MTQPALAFNVRGKGRHYKHPVTGEEVPSITNCIGVLEKPAIPRWAAKLVAENAWKLRHSLSEMGEVECVDVLKGSPWRNSGRAAARGTSVHDYLDARANGRTVALEGEAATYQRGADDFLDRYQPEFLLTEVSVFGAGYAGTADFFARIGGRLVVGDYKSGKRLYPEVALQLAALRFATHYDDGDRLVKLPVADGAVAVLITPDRAEVRDIAADESAFHAFLACRDAWTWRHGVSPLGAEVES